MIAQYPHRLYCHRLPQPAGVDARGYWILHEADCEFVSPCRESPVGAPGEVFEAGGSYRESSSVIYLPKGVSNLRVGMEVVVKQGEGFTRASGKILRVDVGQLHTRVWI